MLVSPQEYLNLTDQLAFLSQKTNFFQTQNKRLTEVVVQQQQTITSLQSRLAEQVNKNSKLEQEIIRHIDERSQCVEAAVSAATTEQMRFFELEIGKIRNDANVVKIRELEKKMTENRFHNHQMVDFYQKIQTLYLVLNNTRTVPSMPELYKWASLRKNQELNNSMIQQPGMGVSQKSFMGGSRMNISKIGSNPPNTNGSNMRGSTMTGSRMMNGSRSPNQRPPTQQRRTSKAKNQLIPSKFKLQKQNNTSMQRKPPLNKKKKKQQPEPIQIQSTESVTQAINIDGLSFENPSDKLIVEGTRGDVGGKQSVIYVDT